MSKSEVKREQEKERITIYSLYVSDCNLFGVVPIPEKAYNEIQQQLKTTEHEQD